MAKERLAQLSSVFDDLLAQNKKRFDDLYVRGRPKGGAVVAAPTAPIGREARSAPSPASGAPAIELAPDSPSARRLKQLFGDDWRYEIAAQERHDDEAIVLCKLIFGKDGAVRAQFGHAKVSHKAVVGASDSIRFTLQADAAGERGAFRRAAEAALLNCVALIAAT